MRDERSDDALVVKLPVGFRTKAAMYIWFGSTRTQTLHRLPTVGEYC